MKIDEILNLRREKMGKANFQRLCDGSEGEAEK